jgi:signal transduction histidine kinase/DNA-binding response OmpR family regulator/HPt (histidine-containing phosphotransfer) domain-containing protein
MNLNAIPKILVLDGGHPVSATLETCASERRFSIVRVPDGPSAMASLERSVESAERFAAVLIGCDGSDRNLPGELACAFREVDPDLHVIVVGGHAPTLRGIAAGHEFPDDSWIVLRAPVEEVELVQTVRSMVSKWMLIQRLREQEDLIEIKVSGRTADLERANRKLASACAAAEAASRTKSEFLANMSHEIRTPMYGVMGMTDLLMESELTDVQRDYVTSVRKSGSVLLNVINDILDFSKIEAGKLELDPVRFELREILGDPLRMLGLKADEKNVELVCSVAEDVPDDLVGDSLRLRQILMNLIGNALKFTERGEVALEVRRGGNGSARGGEEVQFSVRDTGIGIAEDKKHTIFSAFTQADGSTTRRYGGTGLGLTISRSLVEMMGGRIWFESEAGRGTVFHFVLPFGVPPPESVVRKASVEDLAGMSVLVIDDNATNRRILGDMVSHWKMVPTLAENGPDGLAALRIAAGQGRRHDLILLDSNMPEMDGFAVAAAIRQQPDLAGCTIMMLTSADRTGDVRRTRELGLASYLIKPISQPELLREIRRVIGGVRKASAVGQSTFRTNTHDMSNRLRVLIVDDVAVNRRIAQAKVEKLGHSVTLADGGVEAVRQYSQNDFDLVLMDIQMPEMDGFEATAKIREIQASRRRVPVVAMTAMAMKGDREKCLAAGLDDYITKPIEPGALERVLGNVAGTGSPSDPSLTVEAGGGQEPMRGTFDPKVAVTRCMGEEALMTELLGVYVADCDSYIASLRDAWTARDQTRFVRAAHKLKGAVSYFCSDELAAEARWMEETAAKQGLDACTLRLASFEADVERLNREAKSYSLRKAA